jgi:TonB family protein
VADGARLGEALPHIPGIESGDLSLDLILHDIAERARQSTGATGAAIALERHGYLVCRAAAGSTAPDLGAPINVQSGLSGACVRESRLQWCSDSENDDRVDAAACRALGVRSIVVIPLVISGRVAGVFEVFSPQPDAFRDRDIKTLQELAQGVVNSTRGTVPREQIPRPDPIAAAVRTPAAAPVKPRLNLDRAVQILDRRDRSTRILRAIAISLAVLLCVLLALRWGRRNTPPITAHQDTTSAQPALAVNPPDSALNPVPVGMPVQAKPPSGRSRRVTENAALIARDNGGLTVTENVADSPKDAPESTQASRRAAAAAAEAPAGSNPNSQTPVAVPDQELAAISSAPLRGLPPALAAVVSAPAVSVPEPRVSKGLEQGRLLHSVQPKYPPDAIHRRIEGLVVLHALIGKDGSIKQLKALRGDPMLSQAAVEAVRQWRYQPYKLDGAPVEMPIDITINFNMPK